MMMIMNTITITKEKLDKIVRDRVDGIVSEVMSDPDFGLELQDWVKKELKKKPKKTTSFDEIKKNYL
jgi:hypothetical protein